MGFTPTDSIWFNGRLVPWADARVHVLAHGLHYGTGVFEGMRSYPTADGPAVFRLDAHLDARVRGGMARLDADLLDLLRLGAAQLLHMTSVPAYAAIAQTVELAKRVFVVPGFCAFPRDGIADGQFVRSEVAHQPQHA